jgi:hypothetical protein
MMMKIASPYLYNDSTVLFCLENFSGLLFSINEPFDIQGISALSETLTFYFLI